MHEIATDAEVLDLIEALLRMCDGVICATRYIAERYAQFNPQDVRLRERHRSPAPTR